MREIQASALTEVVKRLCIEANCHLPKDMQARITEARAGEDWPGACEILDRIIENYTIADERSVPICQDTGVACVFLEIGQDVHVSGSIADAVNEGVRQGYSEGYLRKSVVADPIRREILNLLKQGRLSAGEIGEHFPVTAASISRHLSVLKEADLIRDQREGKFIYYQLNTSVLEEVMLWLSQLKGE